MCLAMLVIFYDIQVICFLSFHRMYVQNIGIFSNIFYTKTGIDSSIHLKINIFEEKNIIYTSDL